MSSGSAGAGLMSCVREGSLEPPCPYRPPHAHHDNISSHGEGRTGRFLRGLRRMFKRRGSGARAHSPDHKSSSTSELLDSERHARRKEGAYSSGLSVSHDSVFTGERSGDESSDERQAPKHLVSSHRAELVAAVRRRGRGDGSDDDEDLGLPRSPPASPPTDKADKRHHAGISQSSCSDGSLLSVGSSEMDEDSSSGHGHLHSHDHSNRSDHSDFYNSSEPPSGLAPLSHSAAKHKMAVRPRRTHGAPRRKKNNPIVASALPITPELNEEMIRSVTPEVVLKNTEVVTESISSMTTKQVITKEHHLVINREIQRVAETPSDTKLKSSSLPPGLALSQMVGQSPAKLSIAENNTPRSSIKRSKSSSQDQNLRDTPNTQPIENYHLNAPSKCRVNADESCLEKKSKSEKKIENEVIKSTKKEESFFSRLLLRKSGKKSKKDQSDVEGQHDVKKSKTERLPPQYKSVDLDRTGYTHEAYKPIPAERTHKSAGQKVFDNQMHKRLDNKGAYVQENAYKDVYSAAKVTGVEYSITDLKIAEETDKMLNLEIKNRFSRRELSEKLERTQRTTSKETIDDKRETKHEKTKRTASMQRLDPFCSKAFISTEQACRAQEDNLSPALIPDDEPPIRAMRINNHNHNDYVFHSGSMPKNLPYFNPCITVTDSSHPLKTIRHQSHENVKHRSSEHVSESDRYKERKRDTFHISNKTEDSYASSGVRSLGDEFSEARSSIGKSHSFRYASETTSISSQESQMPSLPAIVGISEPLLESWEANYRRNVTDRHDFSKRLSARNYNIHPSNADAYDSLPSTDSSYLDSLQTDTNEDRKLFTNSIHINVDSRKRDSDISQIEAKIDDIISSPKPIIASILKSSSLDSVKSSPEKPMDERRKTISVESALSQGGKGNQKEKEADNFISVTHINKEQSPVKNIEPQKINKSDEKIHKTEAKPAVPEFVNFKLNRVDAKPATNVVLTANVTPKKLDSPQAEREQEIECFKITETKTQCVPKKETVFNKIENSQVEEKRSPINVRKSVQSVQNIAPQSPSTPKAFFKRKATSVELQDKPEKLRTNSMSTDGSTEKIFDNISMDQKSHSSFGSKSSIQSTDSNDPKTPDRQEEAIVYRRKPILSKELRGDKKDDEPELMKVFARRSLKIKDSEADSIAQEIAEAIREKEEIAGDVSANKAKILKNEFNASIKSRDSDKENEDTKDQEDKIVVDIAARMSQFGAPHQYQRSVSINNVNPKRESAPVYRSEVNKYKKEVSDSTPEKRLRNRTFPDPTNDRQEIQNIAKNEGMAFKADTLSKRPWQKKDEEKFRKSVEEKSVVIEKEGEEEKQEGVKEEENTEEITPQYKGILQMRAEWERRAKQAMTK